MSHRAECYEASLPKDVRRAKGIYYTPRSIVDSMLSSLDCGAKEAVNLKLCDPCCGCGNFLIAAIERGFRAENISGFDIDAEAVRITCERILEATGCDVSQSVRVADFWDLAPKLNAEFDIIASNPPWGSHMDIHRRHELSARYEAGHSVDSSALMLLAALTTLTEGGRLTFLLPDAFFNIGGFEDVRRRLLQLNITQLADYGKAFRGLMTRAQSITLSNEEARSRAKAESLFDGVRHLRALSSFRKNPKSIINMWLSAEGAKVVERIYSKPHSTLADNATWGMGIVTGDNERFIAREPREGYIEVIRGYNITEGGVTQSDSYIPQDLGLYQQHAPEAFYRAEAKVLYRFISSQAIFCVDRERRYILNSANGFIPTKGLNMSCEEVVERLNSSVIVWLHKALFRSHKILRHDIERLPLHTEIDDFSEERYLEYLDIEPTEDGGYRVKNRE